MEVMEVSPVRMEGARLTLHVWVVPGARSAGLAGKHGDKVKIRVASPAEAGRANEELIALLERVLGFRPRMIRGISSRHKVFELPASHRDAIVGKLGLGT